MLAIAVATLLAAGQVDDLKTFRVSSTPQIDVANISGRIRIEAAGDSEVSVRSSSDEPGGFTARVEQEGDTIYATVCCAGHCRGDQHQSRHSRQWDGDDWGDGGRCNRGHIDLTLRVPASTRVAARNISGPISVIGVRGEQNLKNISGRISSAGSEGRLRVKVVSGDIKLAPQRVAETSIKTVSGDVQLSLPRNAGANLSLHSLSGELEGATRVDSDDEGRHGRRGRGWGHWGRRRNQERTVGGGGPEIAVKTVSGSVSLRDR